MQMRTRDLSTFISFIFISAPIERNKGQVTADDASLVQSGYERSIIATIELLPTVPRVAISKYTRRTYHLSTMKFLLVACRVRAGRILI